MPGSGGKGGVLVDEDLVDKVWIRVRHTCRGDPCGRPHIGSMCVAECAGGGKPRTYDEWGVRVTPWIYAPMCGAEPASINIYNLEGRPP